MVRFQRERGTHKRHLLLPTDARETARPRGGEHALTSPARAQYIRFDLCASSCSLVLTPERETLTVRNQRTPPETPIETYPRWHSSCIFLLVCFEKSASLTHLHDSYR